MHECKYCEKQQYKVNLLSLKTLQGCALRKIEGSPVLRNCNI